MCTLIIFTNNESLEEINSTFSFKKDPQGNNKNDFKKTIGSINILIVNDGLGFDKQKEIIDSNINNGNNIYIHLHTTIQQTDLNKWSEGYRNANIAMGSHTKSGFYDTILPKIVDNSLTIQDIKSFFFDELNQALNLLHRIYNGEVIDADTLSPELKELFITYYNIYETYDDNKHQDKLIALRDAIIEKELQS